MLSVAHDHRLRDLVDGQVGGFDPMSAVE